MEFSDVVSQLSKLSSSRSLDDLWSTDQRAPRPVLRWQPRLKPRVASGNPDQGGRTISKLSHPGALVERVA